MKIACHCHCTCQLVTLHVCLPTVLLPKRKPKLGSKQTQQVKVETMTPGSIVNPSDSGETSGHTLLQPGRRIMTQHPRLSREPSESIEDREHMRTWRASFWSMKPAQFGSIPDHSAVSLYLDALYTWAQPDPVRNQEDLDRSIYLKLLYYWRSMSLFFVERQSCAVALVARPGQRWEPRQAWHHQRIIVCQPAENQNVQQHSALRLDMAWPCASQHFLLRSDPNGWRLFRLSILKRVQGWQKRPLQERKVSRTGSFGSGWWTRWRCDKSRDQSRDTIWRDMTRQDMARFIKIH